MNTNDAKILAAFPTINSRRNAFTDAYRLRLATHRVAARAVEMAKSGRTPELATLTARAVRLSVLWRGNKATNPAF